MKERKSVCIYCKYLYQESSKS